MTSIDLNCDMGESFGAYTMGMDAQVMRHITSANIACGWHAGDPRVMDKTVGLALDNGVAIGAHPGFPDLLGFGRRDLACNEEEIRAYLVYQIGALSAFCKTRGARLSHVKPHGALYLKAVEDEATARGVARAILDLDPDLIFVALAGKKGKTMRRVGEQMGLKVAFEAFPDRAYTPGGTLVPRSDAGAMISDPEIVADRAMDMANGFVMAQNGSKIEIAAQTLCVHGDNTTAVDLVRIIRKRLETCGIRVAPMGR